MCTSWCEKSRDLKQGLVAQPVLTGSQLAVRPKLYHQMPSSALKVRKLRPKEAGTWPESPVRQVVLGQA